MYASNLSMAPTIPEGIAHNNTSGAFTYGYFLMKIKNMPEYRRLQLLLLYIRDTFCGGNGTKLAATINKNPSYVLRLFYPEDKKGAKGIGPEIMTECSKAFNLRRGFWESDPAEWTATNRPTIENTPALPPSETVKTDTGTGVNAHGSDSYYGWPFSEEIKPWQYNLLSVDQKKDIEKHVQLQILASQIKILEKDPPAEQISPANNKKTGTHA